MTQCGHFLRLYEAAIPTSAASPQDEEGMSMSKNGNKLSRGGRRFPHWLPAMTVAARAKNGSRACLLSLRTCLSLRRK
jgi:hypothetical protein